MKVLIDLTFWKSNQAGGIQTVLSSYLKELEQLQDDYGIEFYLLVYKNEYEILKQRHSRLGFYKLKRRLYPFFREFFEFFLLRGQRRFKSIECILSFNYFSFVGLSSSKRLIVMVHDLNHIDIPNTLGKFKALIRRWLVFWSVKKAETVLTVSNFSADRLKQHYKLKNICVLHNSLNSDFLLEANMQKNNDFNARNYLLFVGSSHPHKNASLLIQFLATDIGSQYELIIVGQKKKAHDSLIQYSHELNVNERVLFTGYVDSVDLAAYYQAAYAFVFPSLYEGFGIPPLEAMKFGCPCLCSNATSIPEVCGDAALYFNPTSINSFSEAIVQLRDTPDLREQLIGRGFGRVKQFSWEVSAKKLCDNLKN